MSAMESPSSTESARVLKELGQLMEQAARLRQAVVAAQAEELAPRFVERRVAERRQSYHPTRTDRRQSNRDRGQK